MTALPDGFAAHVANIGIKDDTDDFVVVLADATHPATGVFTKSRFVGPSVTISRATTSRKSASRGLKALTRTSSRGACGNASGLRAPWR